MTKYATGRTNTLLDRSTTTATGDWFEIPNRSDKLTFQAVVEGSGAVTAAVAIDVSNDGENALALGTISLSGTTLATDGFAIDAPWPYVRARVTGITGTSAKATVTMGV